MPELGRSYKHWPADLVQAVEGWFTTVEDDDDHPINDPCVDNWRYARADNADEVAAFEDAERDGCCGFFNTEIECDGTTIMLGFNYGH